MNFWHAFFYPFFLFEKKNWVFCCTDRIFWIHFFAGAGFEPATLGLWAPRATRLLYPACFLPQSGLLVFPTFPLYYFTNFFKLCQVFFDIFYFKENFKFFSKKNFFFSLWNKHLTFFFFTLFRKKETLKKKKKLFIKKKILC